MKRRLICACLLLAPLGGETLDRIAVTVGKEVIAESQLVVYLRVTAFLDHKPLAITAQTKREAADQLVEQILILQEARASHLALPNDEEAAVLLKQVKAQYATEDEFSADLERHDVTERDLLNHLLAGLQALTFTDLRFRPAINIDDEEVRAYYDKLAANVQGPTASFEESRAQIEELLIGQRVLEALDMWLRSTRETTNVRYRENVFR